jgi:hypothetical protein
LPVGCTAGDIYFLTGSTTLDIRVCNASNQWTGSGSAVVVSGSSGVPTGAIVFVASGACPSGYSEVSALSGRMLRGTVTANGNVGGTGGSDTITPAGTNSAPALTMNSYTPAGTNATGTVTPLGTIAWPAGVPTHSGTAASFSGNALGTHAHELPFQIASTTAFRQIAAATFGTGTSRAATSTQTHTANTTSAAVALSQAVTAGTPAGSVTITNQGTIAWPAGVPTLSGSSSVTSAQTFTGQAATLTGSVAAPAFTGTQFDNRAAYINLIGCQKT